MHLQEFAENSADFQHFAPLHGCMTIPFTDIRIPNMVIVHKADWIPGEEKHIAYFKDHAHLQFMGRDIPKSGADAQISFLGPGGIVHFLFTTELGQILLFMTHLPLEPLLQRTQFVWYADKRIPRLLVSYVIGNWISQWKMDVKIWENKRWATRPMLVREDGPIKQLRRWYSQFYSEKSNAAAKILDW